MPDAPTIRAAIESEDHEDEAVLAIAERPGALVHVTLDGE